MNRRITPVFGGAAFVLALFGAALGGPLEDGKAAYESEDAAFEKNAREVDDRGAVTS